MAENIRTDTSGIAPVKSEFLIKDHVRELDLNYVAVKDKKKISEDREEVVSDEPPRKKLKGQNKHRPRAKRTPKSEKLCFKIGTEGFCPFGDSCCYSHDVNSYLETKPPDIGDKCYLYETFGKCPYSFSCRFGSQHIKEGNNLVNNELWEVTKSKQFYSNALQKDVQKSLRKRDYDFKKSADAMNKFNSVHTKLSSANSKNADTSSVKKEPVDGVSSETATISPEAVTPNVVENELSSANSKNADTSSVKKEPVDGVSSETATISPEAVTPNVVENELSSANSKNADTSSVKKEPVDGVSSETATISPEAVTPNVVENEPAVYIPESKKIDFKDKLFLAPLTTVGNLPFRRICKELGADITCSEMAVALSLLQGQQSEWALLKRHHTEDIFGIQLCGPYPDVMTRCTQLLSETTSFDFIDLNLGCPLDAVYKMGAGCGLMNRMKKLHGMIYGITSVIDVPLTIKMRTGIYGNENLAHNVINKIHQWSDRISLITLHGRSREQRYTKSADWDYINTCSSIASPIPLFGNGDILSYEDYNKRRKETGVAGAMIARGALIKPWIFKEIKEQVHYDISSTERYDILKKYTNYGLEHWGSDTEGVEKTRRFLLEWLSFLYRYIPVGVLERVPQHINERPPAYFGRNDLETLMASPSCSDWIKISEMLLGPVPENFIFLPKHKANAYK